MPIIFSNKYYNLQDNFELFLAGKVYFLSSFTCRHASCVSEGNGNVVHIGLNYTFPLGNLIAHLRVSDIVSRGVESSCS